MNFLDAVALAGTRRTAAGYLIADAKAVRTGIQTYLGAEVGRPDLAVVRVYRDEAEVRSADSLRSFSHAPVTDNHPSEPVTAANWKALAVGEVSTEATWDGNRISLPLILKDAAVIEKVAAGKRELSAGYTCDLDWTPGVTSDGQAYDAAQRNIRANHVAIVDAGRAGPECRIGDSAGSHTWGTAPIPHTPSTLRDTVPMRTLTIDGHSVELSDAAVVAVSNLQKQLGTLTADNLSLATRLAETTKAVETKDGEIVVLKKQVEDAKLTPAALDALVVARGKVIADAKRIAGETLVVDGKTDAEIRRAAVAVKVGDAAAKALSDQAIEGAFVLAAADNKPADPLIAALSGGLKTTDAGNLVAMRDAALAARNAELRGVRPQSTNAA